MKSVYIITSHQGAMLEFTWNMFDKLFGLESVHILDLWYVCLCECMFIDIRLVDIHILFISAIIFRLQNAHKYNRHF